MILPSIAKSFPHRIVSDAFADYAAMISEI